MIAKPTHERRWQIREAIETRKTHIDLAPLYGGIYPTSGRRSADPESPVFEKPVLLAGQSVQS